jgi:GntR family transcriptional regulator / MocR family aminotransferase
MPIEKRKRQHGPSPEIQIVSGVGRDEAPLHTRIYRQLREHILSNALTPGARLPSARTLASDLGVSRNTVESAFDQLVAEGFVIRRVGAGSEVAQSLAEAVPFARLKPQRVTRAKPPAIAPAPAPLLSSRGSLMRDLGQAEIDTDGENGACATDIAGFPRRTWNRFLARQARKGGLSLLAPAPQRGLPELRRQIAEYAALTRGLRCEPEQVLVVSSTQQAIDLAARVLLDPGDEALIEEPGYPSARAALLAAGARIQFVSVDGDGLEVHDLPARPGRRLLYLTPSHQFPLGVTLALARRLAVLRWAAETGAWVLEDDYDSEFRYDGRPLAALHALDTADRVIYVGTYNKVLFPGLRLAYLILPKALVDSFAAARRLTDGYSSPLAQAALAEFMASGQFAAYIRQARQHYSERRDILVTLARKAWGDLVPLGPSATGVHLVAHLPSTKDDASIARSAAGTGLGVAPLSRYYAGPKRGSGLLLSYGSSSDTAIAAGVERLTPMVT